jgi:antitoxin component YwqK of YwqJK toxin-antitoxin module
MKRVPEDSLDYTGDGFYYLDERPFTGVGYSVSEDGWLETETEYRDGLEWGLRRQWYAPNKLLAEAELSRGVKHGKERLWHRNGKLKEEGDYELGTTLKRKKWDENGNLEEDFELKETDSNFKLLQQFREIEKRRSGEN